METNRLRLELPSDLTNEGISESEEQADTNTDHWYSIE